jgi:hypothetical protein
VRWTNLRKSGWHQTIASAFRLPQIKSTDGSATIPYPKGESRPANRRVVIVSPLAFVIQVSSADRIVEIVSVAAFKRKRL